MRRRIAYGSFIIVVMVLFFILLTKLYPTRSSDADSFSAGWSAASLAISKENRYAYNAVRRVNKRYYECIGMGGVWIDKGCRFTR